MSADIQEKTFKVIQDSELHCAFLAYYTQFSCNKCMHTSTCTDNNIKSGDSLQTKLDGKINGCFTKCS